VTPAVAQKAGEEKPKRELGDIFREYGEAMLSVLTALEQVG
jgi:hypothetical protein